MKSVSRLKAPRFTSRIKFLITPFTVILKDSFGLAGACLLLFFTILAIFGGYISPHDEWELIFREDGSLSRMQPPSQYNILGTTYFGKDVLSQTIAGARTAFIVGLSSAICLVFIGTNIGLISGYFGGRIDDVLMRITDIAYGLPFLPFAIILVIFLGPSIWNIVLVVSAIMWRTTARVIRSQVLSLKERPYILSARAAGASDLRILYKHIAPNVLPLSFLYLALGVGWAVTAEASLSFLGFGDPMMISWGQMLYDVFWSGAIRSAWWWVVPPGVAISLFVVACFLIGRSYEEIVNPRLRER